MKSIAALLGLAVLLAGCTSITVNKLDAARYQPDLICIERNPKVRVTDFTSVVQSEFLQHGIETEIYGGTMPPTCHYTLWYTALRSWDFVPYLAYAELNLKKDGRTIATATYKHRGGFALNKWDSTETKLSPVIDKLLSDFDG